MGFFHASLIKHEADEPNEVMEVISLDKCTYQKMCGVVMTSHHSKKKIILKVEKNNPEG